MVLFLSAFALYCCNHFGSPDARLNLLEEERDTGVRICASHFITPVNSEYTIDLWMHFRNAAIDDEEASKQMDTMFKSVFNGDKVRLEAIQEKERRPQKRRPIRTAIGKGPNVYRKRIRKLVEAE